jgi:hypothetical protein
MRAKMLVKFNKIIRKVIDYIDFGAKAESEDSLYSGYSRIKEYILLKIKDQIMRQMLIEGPRVKGKSECHLERSRAFGLRNSGRVDHTGQYTLFGQLWRQLQDRVLMFKKRPKKVKFPFVVRFRGEGGVDAGGLFRETIDQVCDELQSPCLPLFVPTPNNKSNFGEYREKWTVNPSAGLAIHLEMLEFLGALIGMSLRMGHLLALNLPSTVWKRLTDEPVTRSDLVAVDAYCVQCIDDIINIDKKGIEDEQAFGNVIDVCFLTRLSDGSECELMKNGKTTKVTFANRKEYAHLVEKTRLEEGMAQIKAIKRGVTKIVPTSLLRLYSWRELEYKVCGKPTFNVEALKKITRYSVPPSAHLSRASANATSQFNTSGKHWRSSRTRKGPCI